MARLLIVDPSTKTPETEACARIAALWNGETTVIRASLDGWPDVVETEDLAGLIVLGSASSVHDPSAWRDRLVDLLRPIVDGERTLPTLGICYGHQLIAQLAGAGVGPAHPGGEKLLGIREIETVGDCELFDGPAFSAGVSHYEAVEEVPEGYSLIATHAECRVHGLRHVTRPIFCLQCHPEFVDAAMSRCGYEGPFSERRLRDGDDILARFLGLCRAATSS